MIIYADLDGSVYVLQPSGVKISVGAAAGNRLVPAGGTTDQVLKKSSGTDYDVAWAADATGSAPAWGAITGTLSNQTDLNTSLNGKAASSHSHSFGDLSGAAAAGHDQAQTLAGATYSPTFTNVANASSTSGTGFQYLRVGSTVIVYGTIDSTDTSLGVTTKIGITLPVASNFTAAADCRGLSDVINSSAWAGPVVGDGTNDRAEAQWVAQSSGGNVTHHVHFMFQVK